MVSDAFDRAIEIAGALENAQIPYAVGGALALGVWGVPRGTVDVDINAFVEPDQVPDVIATLKSLGISVDSDRALRESAERGMFVGDWDGMRIDVFTPSIEFSYEARRTSTRHQVAGHGAQFLSAESVAVFKLLFFRTKDLADLERLVAVCKLDAPYVRKWIVDMMGDDDPRVVAWDSIVKAFGQ